MSLNFFYTPLTFLIIPFDLVVPFRRQADWFSHFHLENEKVPKK